MVIGKTKRRGTHERDKHSVGHVMMWLFRFFLQRIVFSIAKVLPAQNTVVFASNLTDHLRWSLEVMHAEAMNYPGWRVRSFNVIKRTDLAQWISLYLCLGRAKVIFLDDYYTYLRGLRGRRNGQIVQVWHAAGALKKFGLSALGYEDCHPEAFELATHKPYTAVITSCEEVRPFYAEAFRVPLSSTLPLGVPRTDCFFDEEYKTQVCEQLRKDHPQLQGKKVLLYAPTFRGSPSERSEYSLALDLAQIHEGLGQDYVLILKMHPLVTSGLEIPEDLRDFVIDMSGYQEINHLMFLCDLLITDYSSVVFEFALLTRPMVFFAYDLESYCQQRGFYYDYRQFVPGPVVTTTQELVHVIQADDWDLDAIDSFASRFFDDRDGQATTRVLDHFLGHQ